jgi:serine/threonine protein kinase
VTPAADVYSLAAVLYECLAGQPPRRIRSLADLDPELPVTPLRDVAPQVPQELEDAIMRALARRPDFRPATAAELAAELDGAPTTVALRREHRQRRRLWPALVAALVVVALAAAFVAADGDDPEEPPASPASRIEPVPQGASPDEDARNLAEWLRRYSARTTGAAAGSAFSPNVMPSRASASWTSSRAL